MLKSFVTYSLALVLVDIHLPGLIWVVQFDSSNNSRLTDHKIFTVSHIPFLLMRYDPLTPMQVYSYYRTLPMPITSHKFGSIDQISGKETDDDNGHFVSSVCWRRKSDTVVATNSTGCIKLLKMVWTKKGEKKLTEVSENASFSALDIQRLLLKPHSSARALYVVGVHGPVHRPILL